MNAETALAQFSHEMLAKLQKRDAKQGERSVMRKPVSEVLAHGDIMRHLRSEMAELEAAPQDETECVDVANCAFLLWWLLAEKAGG